MSWSSKKFFGFLTGAAVAGSVLVGCAGDVTIPIDSGTPVIPASGGVLQDRATANESRAAQPNPQQVQVTRESDGAVVSAVLPSETPLTAGEQVALFGTGQPVLDGMRPTGGSGGEFGSGEIVIYMLSNSQPHRTGVFLNENGALSDRLICPNGDFRVSVNGPLAIVRGGNRLDIRSFIMQIAVRNGRASVPTSINGELPVNGGSSFPLHLNATFPTQFANGFATLQVTHDNGLLRQTRRIAADGTVQFRDIVFGENSVIPATGVNTVEFIYTDTNPNND